MQGKWAEAHTAEDLADAPGQVCSVSIEQMSASELHCGSGTIRQPRFLQTPELSCMSGDSDGQSNSSRIPADINGGRGVSFADRHEGLRKNSGRQ